MHNQQQTVAAHAERIARSPLGAAVTLETLSRDPYPTLHALRAHEPVAWIPDVGMWFVTRRDDTLAILADDETFTVVSPHSLLEDTFGPMMLSRDGAEHQRLRRPFAPFYQPRALRSAVAAQVEATASQLIAAFAHAGEADLVASFADPLALHVVSASLGVQVRDYRQLRAWYADFAAALGNFRRDPAVRERGQRAAAGFGSELKAQIDRLRAAPDDSLLGQLVADPDHGLSDNEIVSALLVTIFGGLETTAAMFANTIWALLRHPEQLAALRRDPDRIAAALEEGLRWEAPVQTCTRHVTRPVELRGVLLEPGEIVQCQLGAANRDPETFADPDRFDSERPNAAQHLAFAKGAHYCLGAALARLEGIIGLRLLFERLPQLAAHPAYDDRPEGHEFRAPPQLRVRF
jgi:cytochrome P450